MKNRAAGLILLFLLSPLLSLATHLRAGEITVERTNCTSLTFLITITVYTNTGSDIRFGQGILDFGDGSKPFITPRVENTLRPDLGPNVGTVSFPIEHTYASNGRFVISYNEANRNAGILNIANSVETMFYIETVINIDPFLGCNNSPKLLVPPIDKGCTGAAWYHNPGAYDQDGDSLSFEMTIPKKAKNVVVGNYRDPNNRDFYHTVDYNAATEDQSGTPKFSIDPVDGTILWDAPGDVGEYNIAFLIKEWRKLNGIWVQMGYVTRDMQIIIDDCQNQRPELIVPADICVVAGEKISEDIFGFDPDSDSVFIQAFSQLLSIQPFPATITYPAGTSKTKYQASSPSKYAQVKFEWQTSCINIKEQPYQVVFKITDNPPPGKGAKLVQFKTWNITVVGPPPVWNTAAVVPATRSANLSWDPYACSNATSIQVWRRVDSFPFTPPECVTGIPDFLGFVQIATVPRTQTTFTDNNGGRGLAIGAQYCYRLVATYPAPGGGQSIVSDEICIDPLKADRPIITNVSVTKTDETNGQMRVSWRSPFEIEKTQYPPPYEYEVFRAEGITGNIKIQKIHPGRISDTTILDAGLNTENQIYNYRIIGYDANGVKTERSDSASSVRLEAKPLLQKIELTWAAEVPWSNRLQAFPTHRLFRGLEGTPEDNLEFIAEVNVVNGGLRYTDSGQHNNQPLNETQVYCYRVETFGGYGNPNIDEPLRNFSQMICAQPNDNTPPCKPELSIIAKTCDEISATLQCGTNLFSNTLTWKRPSDAACRNDIRSYNIYKAERIGAEFKLLYQNVVDTFFVDSGDKNLGLTSMAGCYKISAVDRSGNESELSEEFCFDNCPYYELPNVFSPNGDGCNDTFRAFSDNNPLNETTKKPLCENEIPDPVRLQAKCARFVIAVDFTVYNRWGEPVYTYKGDRYQTDNTQAIYINWDGKDNKGKELSSAVYYYTANVTYDVVDPAQATKAIKGWVHLIR